jgi:hypothetical protein
MASSQPPVRGGKGCEMGRRPLSTTGPTILALAFAACGGDNGPTITPTPTATPPTRAEITFRLDPNPVTTHDEGGGQYAYKVNLEFFDTAGVGFTINTIRTTILAGSVVVLDETDAVDEHVSALGRTVLQLTLRYKSSGGRVAHVTRFTAQIADDRGNAISLTAEVNVLHRGEPHRMP